MSATSSTHDADVEVPAGPGTYESMMMWCDDFVAKLMENTRMQEAFASFGQQRPVYLCSDYSGKGCAEMTFDILARTLCHHLGLPVGNAECWQSWRASDVDEVCRRVLLSFDSQRSPQHIFGDITERMPVALRKTLKTLLDEHTSACRAESAPAQPKKKSRIDAGASHGDEVVMSSEDVVRWGRKFMEKAKPMVQECTAWANHQWCYKCKSYCPLWPPVDDEAAGEVITVAIAGYCCQPWSQMGKRERWLSPLSLPWLSWAGELLHRQPHIIIGECTSLFDLPVLKSFMDGSYCVSGCTFSPKDLGEGAVFQDGKDRTS